MKTNTNKYLVPFILFVLAVGMSMAACEGPAGPKGAQGEDGQDGQGGAQGQAGPSARVINLSLQNHLEEAKLAAEGIITSPEPDTGIYQWAGIFDTTLTHVAVADTEVVFVYANLPGIGFAQLPLNIDYSRDHQITQFSDQPSSYSYSQQSFIIDPFIFDEFAFSFGDSTTSVYGAALGALSNPAGVLTFTVSDNESELSVRVTVNSGLALSPNTQYLQALANGAEGQLVRFPLDSDISNSERDEFITTDANGEFVYEATTGQLTALKDTLGADLNEVFGINLWSLFTADTDSTLGGNSLSRNPITRNVQLFSQWSADSIRVTGYMEGINFGNDPTAYVNNFPLDIRVVIVGGNSVGKRTKMSYGEIETLFK